MGCVKQIDTLAFERPGNLDLLRNRVVARLFRNRPEVLPKLRQGHLIFRTAEQHELRVVIETRQVPEQVANVGADAEIVQLPGVDADAHASYDTCWAGRWR